MIYLKYWTLTFLLVPFISYGQSKWTTINYNENLSFVIPTEYKKSDTLGQENFLAKTDFAYIQVVKIPEPQAQISNEKELIDYYTAFQKLTIDQGYGNLVSDSTIRLNDLLGRVFQYETVWNDSLEIQESTIVFVNKSVYSFTYAYFNDKSDLAEEDREVFFAGIAFRGADFKDQLTIEHDKNVEAAKMIGYILRYVILAIILLAVVLFFLKKYQQVKSIINILSLGLLTWGAFCTFFYFVDRLMNRRVDFILITGVTCLIIGVLLRKLKLPLTK